MQDSDKLSRIRHHPSWKAILEIIDDRYNLMEDAMSNEAEPLTHEQYLMFSSALKELRWMRKLPDLLDVEQEIMKHEEIKDDRREESN